MILSTWASGCSSGSYAPNVQVDRAVLGPAPASEGYAAVRGPTAPTEVAPEPIPVSEVTASPSASGGAASVAPLVWPTQGREIQRLRLAAQLHVLERLPVRALKPARRPTRSKAPSPDAVRAPEAQPADSPVAGHPVSESAVAGPVEADSAPEGATLAEVIPATGDAERLECAAQPPEPPNAAPEVSSRDAAGTAGGAEPRSEAFVEQARSAAPPPSLDGSEFETALRPPAIENESALQTFHSALSRLSRGEEPEGKVRILAYGASHTQADYYPGYLRAYFQSRFGDGGRGFVLLGRVNSWHSTLDARMRQRGLTMRSARLRREPTGEPLGLFGAALVGRSPGSFAEILTAEDSNDTRFELQYHQELGGGDFVVELDGKRLARITTQPDRSGPAYFAFEAPRGQHLIQVRLTGNGPVRLFGVVAETATPGVVIDTLGISGARLSDSLRWDEASFIDAVRRRQPDLVTLAYGTNEAFDSSLTVERYEADARSVLERLRRAAPAASCLFISPFDLPEVRHAQLRRIVDAQRRLAREQGCGFWDGLSFMGGEGAMEAWVKAKPSLAARDHIHLTRRGYVIAGTALGDALLRTYDLEADRDPNGHVSGTSSLLGGEGP